MRYFLILLLYGNVMVAFAQVGSPALSTDPVFSKVLTRRIGYPPDGRRQSRYGRFYVGFDVDEQGQVQNVAVLSPIHEPYGFEQAVLAGLKKMPHLSTKYAGHYALPVAFVYTNYNESPNSHLPTNTLSADVLGNRVVLNELTVADQSYSDTRRLLFVPPSHQIGPHTRAD